jgi:hypothetical protein
MTTATRTNRPTATPTHPAVLLTPAVVRAVTVYETAAVHAAYLGNVALSGRLSDLDAESLAVAEDLMAGSLATLVAAGVRYLVEAA